MATGADEERAYVGGGLLDECLERPQRTVRVLAEAVNCLEALDGLAQPTLVFPAGAVRDDQDQVHV